MTTDSTRPLLDVRDLSVVFSRGRRHPPLRAVDGVSFSVGAPETVGLVGESGSGKTTLGRAILGLVPIADGSVLFDGEDITRAAHQRRRELSADIQVVFQDPYSSLNPTRTIGQTLAESLRAQGKHGRDVVRERTHEMLERVGLPADAAKRDPANFSGGQRQRLGIARALMARPRFVICDEPTSALDLSVQAHILNLLNELQDDFELSYLFVSHDLAVVRHVSRRIVVLYHGRIMEQGDAAGLYTDPLHPYTQALLAAAPVPDPDEQRRRRRSFRPPRAAGETGPSRADSCPFAPRCPYATGVCFTEQPPLEFAESGTAIACHHWRDLRPRGEQPSLVTAVAQKH